MPRPKRRILATTELTSDPPDVLPPTQVLARIMKNESKNLFSVTLPTNEILLVELPARFRSTIWIRRGSYVVVDRAAFTERENKLGGEIVKVVREEKTWRKKAYW